MKNVFLAVLVLFMSAYSLDKAVTTYTAMPLAVISSSGTNRNTDSLKKAINRVVDTCNITIPRWVQIMRGDSAFHRVNVDSIRSNPNVDSITGTPLYVKGRIVVDTIAGTTLSSTTATHDSIYTRAIRGAKEKLDSTLTADSINARAINAAILNATNVGTYSTAACSLFDGTTYRATGTYYARTLGNIVILILPALSGTITTSTATTIHIPSSFFIVGEDRYLTTIITNNGTQEAGFVVVSTNKISILNKDQGYLTAGTGGIKSCVITYFKFQD